MANSYIDDLSINTIRLLGVEMINKAKSGHPGIVLGSAPMAYTLFTRHINIDSETPDWWNRDRFVLSAGHGSALLYALMHLSGFGLTIDDLKQFRQLNSKTPGHPEYNHTPGIEMTTGPLGQGLSTAVGMAIAEKYLANHFNREQLKPFDHYTYVLCGDGDLQEGVTMEAASLAGHLALNKLIVLYDSNDIQLDGEVEYANTENVGAKFKAMNWNHLFVKDGNSVEEIDKAITEAKKSEKPTIIEIKTVIGYGCPAEGTNACHGNPLGEENTKALRKALNYDYPAFEVPAEVYENFNETLHQRGYNNAIIWQDMMNVYAKKYKDEFDELNNFMFDGFKINDSELPQFNVGEKESTRKILGKMLDVIVKQLPNSLGGSADLVSSTFVKGADGNFEKNFLHGRNLRFGVREHAMGAIVNGIVLHGGLHAYGAGFFVFSDYLKPAMRLAAIMNIPSIFIFSHDSVCVGEDGPTHEPIEQFAMIRSIPNFDVIRPADSKEVLGALKIAFASKKTPTCITTSRQPLEILAQTDETKVKCGAYVVYEPKNKLDGILISSGSELALTIEAAKLLETEGLNVRVVSMPSPFLFDQQPKEYQEEILPKNVDRRLAVEMGATMPWYKYSRNVFGIDRFGISAPLSKIHEYFGFTKENIAKKFKEN